MLGELKHSYLSVKSYVGELLFGSFLLALDISYGVTFFGIFFEAIDIIDGFEGLYFFKFFVGFPLILALEAVVYFIYHYIRIKLYGIVISHLKLIALDQGINVERLNYRAYQGQELPDWIFAAQLVFALLVDGNTNAIPIKIYDKLSSLYTTLKIALDEHAYEKLIDNASSALSLASIYRMYYYRQVSRSQFLIGLSVGLYCLFTNFFSYSVDPVALIIPCLYLLLIQVYSTATILRRHKGFYLTSETEARNLVQFILFKSSEIYFTGSGRPGRKILSEEEMYGLIQEANSLLDSGLEGTA